MLYLFFEPCTQRYLSQIYLFSPLSNAPDTSRVYDSDACDRTCSCVFRVTLGSSGPLFAACCLPFAPPVRHHLTYKSLQHSRHWNWNHAENLAQTFDQTCFGAAVKQCCAVKNDFDMSTPCCPTCMLCSSPSMAKCSVKDNINNYSPLRNTQAHTTQTPLLIIVTTTFKSKLDILR